MKYLECGSEKMTREPTAVGFYPFNKDELREKINKLMQGVPREEETPRGLIVPHAGYNYSGKTAAYAYKSIENSEINKAIILGVNHHGIGADAAVSSQDWETPLGVVKNNEGLRKELLENPLIQEDELPHANEHSIDVQMPFIKYINRDMEFVPVSLKSLNEEDIKSISGTIRKTLSNHPGTVLIASSDLLHVGPHFSFYPDTDEGTLVYTDKKNKEFIEKIKQRNFRGVMEAGEESTVCGYLAIAALMKSIKEPWRAKVLHYCTSHDLVGDETNVVGYVSISII